MVAGAPGSSCLEPADFERGLFARITRPRGNGTEGDTKIMVRFETEGESVTGTVTIIEPGEVARERVVRGRSCADVAFSVVLVAALALGGEPGASGGPTTLPEPADDAFAERIAPRSPAPLRAPWTARTGAHASVAAAGSGETSVAGDIFGEVSRQREGFSPGLRVALSYATAARTDDVLAMRVSVVTARLEPSLMRVTLGPFACRLVPVLEGGAAVASASGATRSETVTRPWLRGGAMGEIALDVVGPVGIELSGGAMAAFIRDDFVVDPAGFGLRVPLVVPVGRAGFLVQLP